MLGAIPSDAPGRAYMANKTLFQVGFKGLLLEPQPIGGDDDRFSCGGRKCPLLEGEIVYP
jgi:hypothetical protein